MTETNRIVSFESEELILVDADDNEIGYRSKADCHDGNGLLHRAFSVFLFNDAGELLLQQRSGEKRLWPSFWSNTCCSHPRRGETLEVATQRRLLDELNISAALEYVYHFCYQAHFDERGSEHELCHVFLGRIDAATGDGLAPNESEISHIRYLSQPVLEQEFSQRPEQFTPWFKQEWQCLATEHAEHLARYAG